MKNRIWQSIRAAVLVTGLALGACGVKAEDCKLHCDYVRNDCVKKCTDDACRNSCSTAASDCTLSCGEVSGNTNTTTRTN